MSIFNSTWLELFLFLEFFLSLFFSLLLFDAFSFRLLTMFLVFFFLSYLFRQSREKNIFLFIAKEIVEIVGKLVLFLFIEFHFQIRHKNLAFPWLYIKYTHEKHTKLIANKYRIVNWWCVKKIFKDFHSRSSNNNNHRRWIFEVEKRELSWKYVSHQLCW